MNKINKRLLFGLVVPYLDLLLRLSTYFSIIYEHVINYK